MKEVEEKKQDNKRKRGSETVAKDEKRAVTVAVTKTPFLKGKDNVGGWLDDDDNRTYKHMDFLPPPQHCPSDVFNTWRGFAAERLPPATDADKELMMKVVLPYLQERVSNKVAALHMIIMYFLAHMMVKPGLRPRIALELMGNEGCAKNRFTEFISALVGDICTSS